MLNVKKNSLLTTLVWPAVVLIIALGAFYFKPWQSTKNETITVTADGKVETTPTIAKITASLESKNQNIDLARAENEKKSTDIISKLKDLGISEKDIKTQSVSAGPSYENQIMIYPAPPRPTTNSFSSSLEITIRDFSSADKVIATLTAAGASNLYGPNLTVDDEKLEKAKSEARNKAVENAKTKANELAQASGRKVGKVISIKEGGDFGIPMPIYARSSAELQDKASTIQPGQNDVSITLSVDFALK